MEELKIAQLFDLTETIAAPLFMRHTYPWEVLPEIGEYILELGGTLSFDEYELVNDNIWIAKECQSCTNGKHYRTLYHRQKCRDKTFVHS